MTVQITFVSRGHHFLNRRIISQHMPTIPDEPSTSEPSAHTSARPTTTGRARRATVSMLEIGGVRSSALPHTAAFSALPSEAGRNSGFFLHPYASPLTPIGPRSVDPHPHPKHHLALPRTRHRNSTTPYGSYAPHTTTMNAGLNI